LRLTAYPGVLAALCLLHFVPVPTGRLGKAVLAHLTPDGSGFVLRAEHVAWRFPCGAVLKGATIGSSVQVRADRLEVGLSPWRLLTGRFRIEAIDGSRLEVSTPAGIAGATGTLEALDSVPLGRWFPKDVVPERMRVADLSVRSSEGAPLVRARRLELRRLGQELSITADSARLLGFLPASGVVAHGSLPFQLDTLRMGLPGGGLAGRVKRTDDGLQLSLGLELSLDAIDLGLGSAVVQGHAVSQGLEVSVPLDGSAIGLAGKLLADGVRIRGFSYAKDAWVRQYAPELAGVGLGHVEAVPGRFDGDRLAIASLRAQGDTLGLDAKGWIRLDGRLQLRSKVELADRYAATRPALLRAGLVPSRSGFRRTSVEISGSLRELHLAPTSEAVSEAASHPFHALSAFFH
jgi:hypothetical protein